MLSGWRDSMTVSDCLPRFQLHDFRRFGTQHGDAIDNAVAVPRFRIGGNEQVTIQDKRLVRLGANQRHGITELFWRFGHGLD